MKHPALKREVSINKMLIRRNQRLRRVDVVSNNSYDFTYLTGLNFEDGDSSQNLKVWVSSPEM